MLADACRRVIAELGERPDGAADVAGCLVVVGQDEHRAGRYDDALRRYRAAAELAKRAGARDGKSDNVNEAAPNTKKRATFLINEATALVAADRYAQAVPVLEEIMALEAPARIGNLLQIGVFDRYHYMASEGLSRTAGNRLVALSFLSPQVDARRGLASVLIQKAMFSEIGRIANQAILDSGPAANADWQAQLALRQLVARVVHSWQGSLREMPNSDRHDMLALFEASDALEQRALARVSTRLGAAAWQGPALADVIARLTSSDALVELVRFDPIDPALVKRDVEGLIARPVPAHYGAFVVSGRTRAVQAIDLGEAHVIDDAVAAYRGVLEQQLTGRARLDEFALAVYGARLHELAVAPVLHALGRVKRLYVAPDGQLAVVPFEALSADPEPDAIRYLGEDVEVIYLSTGRDLVRPRVAAATREAWLVGDPAFDASAAELTAHLGSRQAAPSQRNARSGSAANGLWPALPETRALLDAAGAVAARAGLETHVLDRAAASEGNVLRIRRPRLLLLATHGTFNRNTPQIEVTFTRLEISDEKGTQVEGFSEHQLRAGDPLIRSSIILAGANRDTAASRGVPKQIDGATIDAGDGVLTAYEVWGMDLRGTELVALGACESGLGVVEAGGGASQWLGQPQSEVVAGLRQAFLVAGARSIVMSLWRVPVDETTAQMKQFLDGWLGRGLPRYRAFREAQLTALARARQTHRGGHPLWWAGFVYTGDTGE
jgi:CHAT domain-containing protein